MRVSSGYAFASRQIVNLFALFVSLVLGLDKIRRQSLLGMVQWGWFEVQFPGESPGRCLEECNGSGAVKCFRSLEPTIRA